MTTNLYRVFDLNVSSDIPFPELVTAANRVCNIEIARTADLSPFTELDWSHQWRDPEGKTALSIANQGSNYYLRFPGQADILVSRAGDSIRYHMHPAADIDAVTHLLLDQVLPRIMALRGTPVLHASAVSYASGMLTFLGESGAGKSTIAATLHAQGLNLLADDCIALGTRDGDIVGLGAYAGARLWDDSPAIGLAQADNMRPLQKGSSKFRVMLGSVSPGEWLPVLAAFLIKPDYEATGDEIVSVQPLGGSEKLMALLEHSFRLDVRNQTSSRRHLEKLGEVIKQGLPVFQLNYPHRSLDPGDLTDQILEALEATTGESE
jgi:hypothetical protein